VICQCLWLYVTVTELVLVGYNTPRSVEAWHRLGQRSWTCCWPCIMEGAGSWRYAPLWCMILMMVN